MKKQNKYTPTTLDIMGIILSLVLLGSALSAYHKTQELNKRLDEVDLQIKELLNSTTSDGLLIIQPTKSKIEGNTFK